MEKEDLPVLNEILAKINAREKLIGIGAIVFVVGWLVGLILASVSYGSGVYSYSVNVWNESGGTGLGLLGVLAAIAAVVVIYLKYAPNMKITWPAPIPVILLGIAGVAALVALYLLWNNFSNSQDWGKVTGLGVTGFPSWPITDWIAVAGVVVGAGIMLWGAYQEWTLSKTAV
jgi:hypothetical protein